MQDSAVAKHTVFIEDLMGKQVQTVDGHTLGRVFELRLSSGPDYGVEALLLGRAGLAHRFDLSRAAFYHLGLGRKQQQVIPWSAVASFDGKALMLHEDWQPPDDDAAPPS
jgi:sporulation protein YlmC with PRC-barrel domain